MPAETVSLLIGGKSHTNWESYSIDSNLLTPADAWQVALGTSKPVPDNVFEGAPVQVQVGDETVLSGRVDDIEEEVSARDGRLALSGRDGAAVLMDCSAPIFVSRQVTLAEVVEKIVKPLGITKVRIGDAGLFEKVNAEPGETAWDVLQHAAEANGLWPWFEPDGTLVVDGADYSTPVVAEFVLNYEGQANNVLSLRRSRSMVNRYSEISVLGQAHGTEINGGEHAILGKATDPSLTVHRPRIIIDSESVNREIALRRARKLLADGRLEGYTLSTQVVGHRVKPDGELWKPGMRVQVSSDRMGIDAVFFVMGRTFKLDRFNGTTTDLLLKEDGVWTLDAYPQRKRLPRIKTKEGDVLEVVEFSQ
jgi:prophage tail gpP-like protein